MKLGHGVCVETGHVGVQQNDRTAPLLDSTCAVKRHPTSAGEIPARQLSLQPVAIGASGEATNSTKPPVQKVAFGRSANMQAVMRVNAEQASKLAMRKPTLLAMREGRRRWGA